MSYTRNFQHIVFRTKCSELTIPEDQKRILLTFLFEYCKRARVYLRRVNAYRNHVHMLVDLPPSMPISEFVRGVKSRSSAELSIAVFSRISTDGLLAMPRFLFPTMRLKKSQTI